MLLKTNKKHTTLALFGLGFIVVDFVELKNLVTLLESAVKVIRCDLQVELLESFPVPLLCSAEFSVNESRK